MSPYVKLQWEWTHTADNRCVPYSEAVRLKLPYSRLQYFVHQSVSMNPSQGIHGGIGAAVFYRCYTANMRPFASTPAARTKDTVIWSFNGQNCSFYHLNWINVIEGKIKGEMGVARRRGRRRKKLLDDLKDRRGYCHLKEEALDSTVWRNRFGGGFGPVVRQNTELMNEFTGYCCEPDLYMLHKFHVPNLMAPFHCVGRTKGSFQARGTCTMYLFRNKASCYHLAKPPNWRTIPCRVPVTPYSTFSQLPSILNVVPPPATKRGAMS